MYTAAVCAGLFAARSAKKSMANCECASAITAEMSDWVKLGGGNSGCCGNSLHTYGFHCPATAVPVTDYSRSHEAPPPYRMNWACAGDFAHSFKPALMAKHATLLGRLMKGELPMICEMITKPWPDKPVYYWARWNGDKTLQRYTGAGHDSWSHISWWRSKANQRAYLWTPAPAPNPAVGSVAPKYPGYVMQRNDDKVDANVRVWQSQARARGPRLDDDGIFGPITQGVAKAFQKVNGLNADGKIEASTWSGIWNLKLRIF